MSTVVLANGRVVTCDDRNTVAEAVAIHGGRVLAVGGSETVLAQAGSEAHHRFGREHGHPRLDRHPPHLMHFDALAEPLVDIGDATSRHDIAVRIAQRARQTPPGEWIMTTRHRLDLVRRGHFWPVRDRARYPDSSTGE
jgi:predicted amidohydrolase YtcJ